MIIVQTIVQTIICIYSLIATHKQIIWMYLANLRKLYFLIKKKLSHLYIKLHWKDWKEIKVYKTNQKLSFLKELTILFQNFLKNLLANVCIRYGWKNDRSYYCKNCNLPHVHLDKRLKDTDAHRPSNFLIRRSLKIMSVCTVILKFLFI